MGSKMKEISKNKGILSKAADSRRGFMKTFATIAAATPNITSKNVATKLCKAFLPISLKVLSANLHPTDEPKINKQ